MFLSDISYLQRLNSTKPLSVLESTKGNSTTDQYELELERLFNSSPIITEWTSTYSLSEMYKAESEDGFKRPLDNGKNLTPISFSKNGGNDPLRFSPIEVKPVPKETNEAPISFQPSGLTKLIQLNEKSFQSANNKGKMRLTIYLPDFSDMLVYAAMDCTVNELIRIILKQHEQEDLDPPLDYRNPSIFELRMHEGDGEPDRDFPAYNGEQRLRDIQSDEFCLCELEDRQPIRTYSYNDSLFSPPPLVNSHSDKSTMSASSSYKIRDPFAGSPFSDDVDSPPRITPQLENSVTIRFPDGKAMTVEHGEEATLRDLLPSIAKQHRIRIYTDEYEFLISTQDQKMLSLTSPIVDIDAKIYSIGTRIFEIQKKIYADTPRILRGNMQNRSSRRNNEQYPQGNNTTSLHNNYPNFSSVYDESNITFTEATANAYQQWNVVKKNKFGIRQERIFGVDGKKVYNAKRGQLRGGNSGVQRAERDITSIVKIEKLQDNKTFRITWMDNGDIYYIEYTCETIRECSEIVAKIRYLLNRRR